MNSRIDSLAYALAAGAVLFALFESLQLPKASFGSVLMTTTLAQVLILWRGYSLVSLSFFNIFVLYSFGAFSMCVYVWAILQFSWFVRENAPVAIMAEPILLLCLPAQAFVVISWGIINVVDYSSVPFFMSLTSCALLYMYGRPLVSSFRVPTADPRSAVGGSQAVRTFGRSQGYVLDAIEMGALYFFLACLPPLVHLVLHHRVIWSDPTVLLVLPALQAIPLLFATLPGNEGQLWWLGLSPRELRLLCRTATLIGLLAILAAFEARVVFVSFRSYVQLPFPYDVVAVTGALLVMGVLVWSYVTGVLFAFLGVGPAVALAAIAGGAPSLVLRHPAHIPVFAAATGAFFILKTFHTSNQIVRVYRDE